MTKEEQEWRKGRESDDRRRNDDEEEKEEIGEPSRGPAKKPPPALAPTSMDSNTDSNAPGNVDALIARARRSAQRTRESRMSHQPARRDTTSTSTPKNEVDVDDFDVLKLVEKRARDDNHSNTHRGPPRHTVSHSAATRRTTSSRTAAAASSPPALRARQTAPAGKLPRTPEEAAVTPGAYSKAPGKDLRRNRAARYSVLKRSHQPSNKSTQQLLQEEEEQEEDHRKLPASAAALPDVDTTAHNEREAQIERKEILQQMHIISSSQIDHRHYSQSGAFLDEHDANDVSQESSNHTDHSSDLDQSKERFSSRSFQEQQTNRNSMLHDDSLQSQHDNAMMAMRTLPDPDDEQEEAPMVQRQQQQTEREEAEHRKRILADTHIISSSTLPPPAPNGHKAPHTRTDTTTNTSKNYEDQHFKGNWMHSSTTSNGDAKRALANSVTTSHATNGSMMMMRIGAGGGNYSPDAEQSPLRGPVMMMMEDGDDYYYNDHLEEDPNYSDYDENWDEDVLPQQPPPTFNDDDDDNGLRGARESIMVEATLVQERSQRTLNSTIFHQDTNVYTEAKAMDSNDIMWAFLTSPKGVLTVCLACLLIIGAIVGMIVGLERTEPAPMPTLAPSLSPSFHPTLSPTQTFTIDMLPVFSQRAIERNPESPQAFAWEWLQADNDMNDYPLSRQLQRYALAAFYFSTSGPRWRDNSHWLNVSVSECHWKSDGNAIGTGFCVNETTRFAMVTSLMLSANGLSGTIPPEISLLTELRVISLGNNAVDGSIPSELGLLTNLRALVIEKSDIGGAIPLSFRRLSRLESLVLSDNDMRGHLRERIFANTTSLKRLELQNNEFLGLLPTSLQHMSLLTDVDISNCRFSGSIPTEIALLSSLVVFRATGNFLRGSVPPLANLTNLLELDLTNNQLTGPLGDLPSSLSRLHLGYNLVTEASFEKIVGLASLSSLDLEGCQLRGTLPTETGVLTTLKHCALSNNRLSGTIPSEVALMTRLDYLGLGNNLLTGKMPSELGTLHYLEVLHLQNNQLSSSIPYQIGHAWNLVNLNFQNNLLSGPIPSQLGNLRLEYLEMSRNQLSGHLPSELGWCQTLVLLSAAHNKYLNGTLPSELGRLSFLEILSLAKTSIYGSIPTSFGKMTTLLSLNLSNCQLGSSLPSELGRLSYLRMLELSHNKFSGTVPSAYGGLRRLEYLGMNRNNFTARRIPSGLGVLRDLTYLGGSGCGFIGSLPSELYGLPKLTALDVSQNNITGPLRPNGRWKSLISLKLFQNEMTGTLATELGMLTVLELLALDFNEFVGRVPSEIGALTLLTSLHLDSNDLSGSLPSELGLLTGVIEFELANNQNLSGSIPSELFGLSNMNEFDLYKTRLTGQEGFPAGRTIPSELALMMCIDYLNNLLTGKIASTCVPSSARQSASVEHPYATWPKLGNNLLSGQIPSQLGNKTVESLPVGTRY
ncbi:leucine rich repeat [Seminavis robusta]|uniref:Leucine rich repeat n=1 Tax=Seminavis robusta TaxID=568900 RepID=A0A9N8HCH5_9STRA|nr:leucine rich repeat [Seminavis robusta]|eukprot:Sro302_g112150.1 leucine rich repeat (1446) ;mRNA; f:9620-14556